MLWSLLAGVKGDAHVGGFEMWRFSVVGAQDEAVRARQRSILIESSKLGLRGRYEDALSL